MRQYRENLSTAWTTCDETDAEPVHTLRRAVVLGLLALGMLLLLGRAIDLQILNRDFLRHEGDMRHLRVVPIPAHRGMITDRSGEPLAISSPVDSIWASPKQLLMESDRIPALAARVGLNAKDLRRQLEERKDRAFVYLKRHVDPSRAAEIMALGVGGVFLKREYRRYYPTGEVAGHVLGFTDIDDRGQEGLERAFDKWLRGTPGAKRVLVDGERRVVEDVERIRAARPGRHLTLSIDRRIQYLAYRGLKSAVVEHKAKAGSAVVLDVRSGEILAMVNQPTFNPNRRQDYQSQRYRNRAITDVFEPGSTIKPFIIVAALQSGRYTPDTPIDTTPGLYRVGRKVIRDIRNFGLLDVTGVMQKSSNVGASKIALSLQPQRLWSVCSRLGFGTVTGSSFPGEAAGLLRDYHGWREIELATLSYGYGISVTALQLARAYTVLAADGVRRGVSFLRLDTVPEGQQVMPQAIASKMRHMLEQAVSSEGTGALANVQDYRVAGKTGTVRKSAAGGYARHRYQSLFAGLAPAHRPRLVMVVIIDEPANSAYYGGEVAAPVFGQVMAGALRLLDVPPDDFSARGLTALKENKRYGGAG
jgi:Cell division protein FtsI/penicillin-binding protein 2